MMTIKEKRTDYYFRKKEYEHNTTLFSVCSTAFLLGAILTPSTLASCICIMGAIYWGVMMLIVLFSTGLKLKKERKGLFK